MEVSAGIVVSGSRVLCMKKGKAGYSYTSERYEFPGGKLEPGETAEQALIRELKEEMDADVRPGTVELFHDLTYDYPDFSVLLHYFIIRDDDFRFKLKEHAGYVWQDPGRLSELDWLNADAELIELYGSEIRA